ncbi:MAG: type I DNA topoisomerase [Phycisphaerales bacterium]|nr:MAG: type I DNA topoisomerase [Phycisphaerales bacterium]
MAKKPTTTRTKKAPTKKTARSKAGAPRSKGSSERVNATGKQLVIVESPAKAKTINKYLGSGYVVKASVGHVRDLPTKSKKGEKAPVPGVDLEHDFEPSYEVLPGKSKTVTELKRAAKQASDIWFATDLDREGEAIAWHLAQELGIKPGDAKRVVFNAITATEIKRAFSNPHPIDENKVNAQQARRVLDRIVGYQVSPLLWKKVARGLSAGRVQSVAVRLVVEREREIRAFVPDEYWRITGRFALDESTARKLMGEWGAFLETRDEKGAVPTIKAQNAWLAQRGAVSAELVEVGGEKFEIAGKGGDDAAQPADLSPRVLDVVRLAGLTNVEADAAEDEAAKGPARWKRTVTGTVDASTPYKVTSIETKRTSSRPPAPFITSTLQQAASSRLSFGAQRTMRAAQQLYEGVDIPGEGSVGLITYMRTDSTHLTGDAIQMARDFIQRTYGDKYLPEKPNFFSSSNRSAQEAHEAIRPTSLDHPPEKIRNSLKPDQFRLYQLIWDRFVACQMTPSQWDATSVLITGGTDPKTPVTFRATGRVLVFDGYLRVAGVPQATDEQTLPSLEESRPMCPFAIEPDQRFTSPPPRYSEASLIKTLESEGIGRPSTYASIIQVIQDRKYAEQIERRFYATDLGEVVTDKLIEAFPEIMELGYTRDLELELDSIEDDNKDWIAVLHSFYGPFKDQLERAHDELTHAKAETTPAPAEYKCEKCGSSLVYRFGKSGRFLSCSTYPTCDYACPIDREGKPRPIEVSDVACHKCGKPMIKRTGRFGPFYGCSGYPECDGILKADKQGRPVAPATPPLETDMPCTKCSDGALVLRNGARGPWLSCSRYPKCRGRGKWSELTDDVRTKWENALAAHEKAHPTPIIRDLEGEALTDAKGKPIEREGEGDDAGSAAA